MYLSISGDVDIDETFKLIEENQSKKQFPLFNGIKCKYDIENNTVYAKS